MLSQETIEKLADYIVQRVEETNTNILLEIAKSLKVIKDLTPSQAQKIVNIFRYGGDYQKIEKKLAEMTKLNQKDIKKIFKEVAKKNQEFAKQFYDYRNIKFIPYEENKLLQRQVEAISTATNKELLNFSKTVGFSLIEKGKRVFTPLAKAYERSIDRAILGLIQGKTTLDDEIHKIVNEYADSGLKVIDYGSTYIGKDGKEHHYIRRLDSAVRMNINDGVRTLTNNMNREFGKEFGADGVELTAHDAPAPDHAEIQGRQFRNEEFDKLQNDEWCKDVTGKRISPTYEGRDRRSISQYNCHHNAFPIIVGISTPQHSDKELEDIKKRNLEGFNYKGKHYTLYEGTQLQRGIETKIRHLKDTQIMATELGADDAVREAQQKITVLTKQYNDLSNISNLTPKKERMRVSGYKRRSV